MGDCVWTSEFAYRKGFGYVSSRVHVLTVFLAGYSHPLFASGHLLLVYSGLGSIEVLIHNFDGPYRVSVTLCKT